MMNSRPPKIAVLASTLIVGGAERQLQTLVRGLGERGFEFHVFLLKGAGTIGNELGREGRPLEARLAMRPWRWGLLRREWAACDALLVLDHNNCLRLVKLWSNGMPPYIVLYHQQAAPPPGWKRPLEGAAAVVAVSRSQVPFLAAGAPKAAAAFIPNGVAAAPAVDAEKRRAARAGFKIPAAASVAACVARLSPEKGVDVLLEAAGLGNDNLFWLIVGDGPARRGLEAAAGAHLPASSYRFVGELADVSAALEAADMFVLPSRRESLPMALLEALARGLPAVAAAVGDVPALLAEVGGVTFPAGDARALRAAVEQVAGDAALRADLSRRGREVTAAEYSLNRMLDAYEALLTRATAAGRG